MHPVRRPASDAASEASSASARSWCVVVPSAAPRSRYVDPPVPAQQQAAPAPATDGATGREHDNLRARVGRLLQELPKIVVAGAVLVVAGATVLKVGTSVRCMSYNPLAPRSLAGCQEHSSACPRRAGVHPVSMHVLRTMA